MPLLPVSGGLIISGSLDISGSVVSNGQSTIQTVKVTATSASILDLPTTPIELVPAPGAGKAIIPISFTMANGFGDQYSGSVLNDFYVNVSTLTGTQFITTIGATNSYPLSNPGTYFTYPAKADVAWYADNQSIVFNTDGNAPVSGTFDVDMYLTYQEITL